MAELNYGLSELAVEIRGMVREFAVSRVKPVRAELDETGRFPAEILRELGKMDLMGLYIPAEYG
ncbi:MAG TPA: acyl-CoA dehydrogenase family protein, partial [Kiritimatiellia bacterium]|nr:acyl-CoA dehydrogenase family protein [Kiritimatiellia bacterium]